MKIEEPLARRRAKQIDRLVAKKRAELNVVAMIICDELAGILAN